MTIKELIKNLRKCDETLRIVKCRNCDYKQEIYYILAWYLKNVGNVKIEQYNYIEFICQYCKSTYVKYPIIKNLEMFKE